MNLSSTDVRLILPLLIGFTAAGIFLQPGPTYAQGSAELDRARSMEQEDEFARARKLYRRYLNENPTSVRAAAGWLRTSIKSGQWSQGERALRRLDDLEPGSTRAAKLGSTLYFRQELHDTALIWAKRYRNRNNQSWKPFHFLAQVYLSRDQTLTASEMMQSATLRSDNNPWVLLDKLLVEYKQNQIDQALETAEKLREVTSDPTIYWRLLQTLGNRYSRSRVAELFAEAGSNLPPEDPPFLKAVDENRYRYWWSRLEYQTGDRSEARDALGNPREAFRSSWLRAHLNETVQQRKRDQQRVLNRWPDELIAQWQHSRLVKSTESLRTARRRNGAGFFFQEYRDNRFLNYREAALTALLRSLELNPLNEQRQFTLAQYYRRRGWSKKERMAAERAETLGFTPPSQVADYIEGLGEPDTTVSPDPPQPRVGVHVELESLWAGPLDGASEAESIFRQNLYHQPGFRSFGGSIASEDQLSTLVRGDTLDAGVSITITEWDDALSASVDLLLPSNRIVNRDFYDNDDMKTWNLLNSSVSGLKSEWPWTGKIYKVTNDGAWVNLGRIHGLNEGDEFTFSSPDPSFPEQLTVDRVREDTLRLSFPSPYYRTIVPRGTTVEVSRQD